jgi:sulfane dehydrogenase subunit SoxC
MDTPTATAPTGATHTLEPTNGPLFLEEQQLALRNPGMPLEAMRYDVTPTGLHYLVAHWDIPALGPANWRLKIGGHVREPLELTLDEVRARAAQTMTVTLECAGNGRGWLRPRPVSLPWLGEAIGTAEWTGTPLRDLLVDAGLDPEAAPALCGLKDETNCQLHSVCYV